MTVNGNLQAIKVRIFEHPLAGKVVRIEGGVFIGYEIPLSHLDDMISMLKEVKDAA